MLPVIESGAAVGAGVAVGTGVGVAVGLGEGVGVGAGVGAGVGVGAAVGVAVGLGDGVGVGGGVGAAAPRGGVGVAGTGVGVAGTGVGVAGTGVGVAGTGVGVAGTGVGVAGTGVGVAASAAGVGVGVAGTGVGVAGTGVGVAGTGVGVAGTGVGVAGTGVGFESGVGVGSPLGSASSPAWGRGSASRSGCRCRRRALIISGRGANHERVDGDGRVARRALCDHADAVAARACPRPCGRARGSAGRRWSTELTVAVSLPSMYTFAEPRVGPIGPIQDTPAPLNFRPTLAPAVSVARALPLR